MTFIDWLSTNHDKRQNLLLMVLIIIYKVVFHVNYYFLIKNERLPSEMANLPKGDNWLKSSDGGKFLISIWWCSFPNIRLVDNSDPISKAKYRDLSFHNWIFLGWGLSKMSVVTIFSLKRGSFLFKNNIAWGWGNF